MIDTSTMVAALVVTHEHHRIARPRLTAELRVPAIVLAETFSQLRRTFSQPAETAALLLHTWTSDTSRILPTSALVVRSTFARAVELDLGGGIHDALIAQTCVAHRTELVTLDRRQHRIALAMGAQSTYLLS
ncbi:MAG TPA: PIN domain-containing protein [Acidimicrobiales bacterium]|nr:PIN domain-containing protein [Acidimicrobiales bacterium]